MGIKYQIKDFKKWIRMNRSKIIKVILTTKMVIHQTLSFTNLEKETIKEMRKAKKMQLVRKNKMESMKTIILTKREKNNKILWESYVLLELKLKFSRI